MIREPVILNFLDLSYAMAEKETTPGKVIDRRFVVKEETK